jgi:transposase
LEKEAEILKSLDGEAGEASFVRVREVKERYESISGTSYNFSAFYRLLQRHKWRKIVPRTQHPKAADEEACEAAKKLTFQ